MNVFFIEQPQEESRENIVIELVDRNIQVDVGANENADIFSDVLVFDGRC